MNADRYKVSVPEGSSGDWRVERFEVPENDPKAWSYGFRAPETGWYTRLSHGRSPDPVMSDTLAEVRDHLEVITKLEALGTGSRVLIHGLGLGMILQVALRNPDIMHVDVVELEEDVIKLVGPHYACSRLSIFHADALKHRFARGAHWDVVWHDIWPTICTDDLAEHATLTRRYARRCNWQGCWAHDLLLHYRKRERTRGWPTTTGKQFYEDAISELTERLRLAEVESLAMIADHDKVYADNAVLKAEVKRLDWMVRQTHNDHYHGARDEMHAKMEQAWVDNLAARYDQQKGGEG